MKKILNYLNGKIRKEYEFLVGDVINYRTKTNWVQCRVNCTEKVGNEYRVYLTPLKKNSLVSVSIFDAKHSYNANLIRG